MKFNNRAVSAPPPDRINFLENFKLPTRVIASEKNFSHFTFHLSRKRAAFTLAEVLITLGIIGIVAAITIPSLITNIQNKGYVEKLNKTYSLILQTTKLAAYELGAEPQYWSYSNYKDGDFNATLNKNILYAYKKNFKIAKEYPDNIDNYYQNKVINRLKISYRYLNGESDVTQFYSRYEIYNGAYVFELSDSTTIGITFPNKTGAVLWDLIADQIKILFTIDINGLAKPNQIGRDIFWFVLKDGKILPYNIDDTSDCTRDGKGYSCAARVITEKKMNY